MKDVLGKHNLDLRIAHLQGHSPNDLKHVKVYIGPKGTEQMQRDQQLLLMEKAKADAALNVLIDRELDVELGEPGQLDRSERHQLEKRERDVPLSGAPGDSADL